jgi:segregation and condensation protein B
MTAEDPPVRPTETDETSRPEPPQNAPDQTEPLDAAPPAEPPAEPSEDAAPEQRRDATAPLGPVPLRPGLEAILFLADEPVEVDVLAEVLEQEPGTVLAELEALAADHLAAGRGVEIRRAAGGWRMYSAALARPAVERWALAGRTGRLTQAALETLAVIAYKQPISRQEISDIRGVNADGAVRSLAARGFVAQVGRDEGPGQALLYGTTPLFLERLGLDSLGELPPLTEFLPEAPAPDEPELGALKEVRRRLAAGGDLERRAPDPSTNTGPDLEPDEDDEALPPPTTGIGEGRADAGMDELTDRLERAARSAVDRLRQAVASNEEADGDADGATAGATDRAGTTGTDEEQDRG